MSCTVTVKLSAIEFPIKIVRPDSCCVNTPSPHCRLGICISQASYPFQTSVWSSLVQMAPKCLQMLFPPEIYHVTIVFFSYSSPSLIQGPRLLLRPMLILPLQWKSNHWEPINWFLRRRLKVAVRWLSPAWPPQQWRRTSWELKQLVPSLLLHSSRQSRCVRFDLCHFSWPFLYGTGEIIACMNLMY